MIEASKARCWEPWSAVGTPGTNQSYQLVHARVFLKGHFVKKKKSYPPRNRRTPRESISGRIKSTIKFWKVLRNPEPWSAVGTPPTSLTNQCTRSLAHMSHNAGGTLLLLIDLSISLLVSVRMGACKVLYILPLGAKKQGHCGPYKVISNQAVDPCSIK